MLGDVQLSRSENQPNDASMEAGFLAKVQELIDDIPPLV